MKEQLQKLIRKYEDEIAEKKRKLDKYHNDTMYGVMLKTEIVVDDLKKILQSS